MLLVTMSLAGCGSSPSTDTLLVLAAASLADVLPPLATEFEARHRIHVELSFASSVALQHQIEQGAPADAFVSAAAAPMDALERASRLMAGSRRDVARNELVAVTRRGRALPHDLASLARTGERIGLGDVGVPVGEYARACLQELGLWEIIEPRVVPLVHEQAVLQAVMRAAVDWGIVYRSSVNQQVDVLTRLPASGHPPVTYPAAVLAGSPRSAAAQAFLDYLVSAPGRAGFATAGFLPPEPG